MDTAVARDVEDVVVVAEVPGGVAPGPNRVALAVQGGLRAEGGVLVELLGAVAGVEQEGEVVVPDVAAGGVDGLEGEAGAVAEAGADGPAGLLLEGGGAGRRDDLGVDGRARVGDVAGVVAGRGDAQRDGGADGEGGPAGQRGGGVLGGDDVGLHRGLGGVGRVAGGHDALVEGALGAVAVVAADAEDDGALLAHRVVAAHGGARAAVVRRQRAGRGVAAVDGPLVGLALDGGGEEAVRDGGVGGVVALVGAGEQVVLEVGHDPGPAAGAVAPGGLGAEVDGLHVAVARVRAAGLGVAVVEAAARVVVGPVEDGVHALGRVARGGAAGGVVAVARAGRDEDAVRLLAVERDRRADRAGQVVVAVGVRPAEAAGRGLGEVVAAAGLVVDDGDEAGRAGAEGVLGGGVGDAARGEGRDGGRGTVGAALDLVERAAVGAVQRAGGAVRGDAGRAPGGVEIARPGGDKGRHGGEA